MRIHDLISEIKELNPGHARKTAYSIYNLLENNKTLFLQHLDSDNFNHLLFSFEALANVPAKDYNARSYNEEVEKNYHLLLFYLDKIL
jgi:hypothetical protein